MGFIESMNEGVRGKPLNFPVTPSPVVDSILQVLEKIDAIIDDTPLNEQPQRFGNKAFATFYNRLCSKIEELLKEALPQKFHKALPEISVYVMESVGNSTRIDYGSGHELSFVMFMYCLFRIGALDCNSKDDKYIRNIQFMKAD
jgi:serine/threonine-protein phosphatase 2A activator